MRVAAAGIGVRVLLGSGDVVDVVFGSSVVEVADAIISSGRSSDREWDGSDRDEDGSDRAEDAVVVVDITQPKKERRRRRV